jgi:hypothetical protein
VKGRNLCSVASHGHVPSLYIIWSVRPSLRTRAPMDGPGPGPEPEPEPGAGEVK